MIPLSDAISAANPRVIDDSRARKLSNDLKRCTYYETCSTYGLNVERVFQDGERGAANVRQPGRFNEHRNPFKVHQSKRENFKGERAVGT